MSRWLILLFFFTAAAGWLRADTLMFANGDELTGHLVRADSTTCIFHSDMAGDVSAPWTHVRELRTTRAYVVVGDGDTAVEGELIEHDGMIEITSLEAAFPHFTTTRVTRMIVDPKTYRQEVLAHPKLWQTWRGTLSGGFSQVSATQSSVSYTASVNLDRPVPQLSWLPQRSETQLHFQGSYGKLSQATEPTVRTSIYTAGLEQDFDLTRKLFVFASGALDHNLAQGLQLQQAYGSGVGWKLFDSAETRLDIKADLHLTRQQFLSTVPQHFLASSFTETLRQSYGRIIWTQNLSLTPSYSSGLAYQMSGLSSWAVPVYHSLSLNFTVIDSYLNNPKPGFLKNSLQISTGVQYSLQ